MSHNQDARPFIDLKKDAEEFRLKFDEDINDCINYLDEQITDLICDPDSLNDAGSGCQSAFTEFSKAKYRIYMSVKKHIEKKEAEWQKYIGEMKKLFIENVEIFLANTKLEVKLPSSEFQPSLGPRKSPVGRKSGVTNSLYPIINTIAKSIPVLGSPLKKQEVKSPVNKETSRVGDGTQFNNVGRLSLVRLPSAYSATETMDFEEDKIVFNRSRSSSRGSLRKSSLSDLNTSTASSRRKSGSKSDLEFDLNTSYSSLRRRSSSKNDLENGSAHAEIEDEVATQIHLPTTSGTLKGKQGGRSKKAAVIRSSSASSDDKDINSEPMLPPPRGRSGRQAAKALRSTSTNSDDGKLVKVETELALSKGRRGRPQAKSKASDSAAIVPSSSISSDDSKESGAVVEPAPSKGRRGRQAAKGAPSKKLVSDESLANEEKSKDVNTKAETSRGAVPKRKELIIWNFMTSKRVIPKDLDVKDEEEPMEEELSDKVRKGRPAPAKSNKKVPVVKKLSAEESNEEERMEEEVNGRGRRGRSAAAKNNKKVPVAVPKTSGRGRRGQKAPEPKMSPKKAALPLDEDSSDSDLEIAIARAPKTPTRRKTLLPNMEELAGDDLIPGNPTRSQVKRKTFGGASGLNAEVPSKRLKAGSSMDVSYYEANHAASDNLLESDDNYSEWMALKNFDGKVPTQAAVYEVKVWRAKKTAFIGSCESLRQKLTLYKLKQSSGHKHLDKFIDRNYGDILVRFEVVASLNVAKDEAKNRIKIFVEQYKTTPAYN